VAIITVCAGVCRPLPLPTWWTTRICLLLSGNIKDKESWPKDPDVMYWNDWPVRHPRSVSENRSGFEWPFQFLDCVRLHRLYNQHRLLRRPCQKSKYLTLGPNDEFSDKLLVWCLPGSRLARPTIFPLGKSWRRIRQRMRFCVICLCAIPCYG